MTTVVLAKHINNGKIPSNVDPRYQKSLYPYLVILSGTAAIERSKMSLQKSWHPRIIHPSAAAAAIGPFHFWEMLHLCIDIIQYVFKIVASKLTAPDIPDEMRQIAAIGLQRNLHFE